MGVDHRPIEPDRGGIERTLARTVLRLCIAAKGLDPALDPHFDRIRRAIKAGVTPDQDERLARLTDDLSRAADERASPGLLRRLIEHAGLSGERRTQVMRLWSELTAQPVAVSTDRLDELAVALGMVDGTDKGHTPSPVDPETQLAELLSHIDWPAAIGPEIKELCQRLVVPGAWLEVVEALSELAAEALRNAQQEAEEAGEFLLQLDRQLQAIDGYLLDEAGRRGESADAAGQFDQQLRADVGKLQDDIAAENDLGRVRSRVIDGLGRIQVSLNQFLAEEAERRDNASERERELRDGLDALTEEAAELRQKLADSSEEARLDQLTKLPNRRAYDERVAQEYSRYQRYRDPLALMLLDIDDFKRVNDAHGHQAGDQVLRQVADTLAANLRDSDFLARYGGEEFIVLMLNVDRAGAFLVAEKMRRAIASSVKVDKAPVTASVGVSLFAEGDDVEAVVARADQALYQAKARGKNRCLLI